MSDGRTKSISSIIYILLMDLYVNVWSIRLCNLWFVLVNPEPINSGFDSNDFNQFTIICTHRTLQPYIFMYILWMKRWTRFKMDSILGKINLDVRLIMSPKWHTSSAHLCHTLPKSFTRTDLLCHLRSASSYHIKCGSFDVGLPIKLEWERAGWKLYFIIQFSSQKVTHISAHSIGGSRSGNQLEYSRFASVCVQWDFMPHTRSCIYYYYCVWCCVWLLG